MIGRCRRFDEFLRLVDVELHAIELLQQIIRKFDIRFINFVDQQYRLLFRFERFPDLAAHDVVGNIVHAIIAELRIAQPRHRIVFVQTLLRFGRRLDVPLVQWLAQRTGNLNCQLRFAGAWLAFYEDRTLSVTAALTAIVRSSVAM